MDSLIDLYTYLHFNCDLKNKLILLNDKFSTNESALLSGLGIVKNIINKLTKLNEILFICDDLKILKDNLLELEKYLINSYGEINANIIFDFLLIEYEDLYASVKKILNM